MLRRVLITLTLSFSLHGAVLITPDAAMQSIFGSSADVEKKTLMLSKTESAAVSKAAKMKLSTRLYKLYTISDNGTVAGYGILISGKVRSKNAAILYAITPAGTIKSVEIVAFNEPPEFIPPQSWMKQFDNAKARSDLHVGKNIPTITGATLSARMVTDNARLALAIFDVKVKP